MKEVKIGERTYRIKILAPWMQAYLQEYGRLARITPASEEEAEKIEGKMRSITEKIFKVVEPKPSEEDAGEIFVEVLKYVNESFAEAQAASRFFRSEQAGQSSG